MTTIPVRRKWQREQLGFSQHQVLERVVQIHSEVGRPITSTDVHKRLPDLDRGRIVQHIKTMIGRDLLHRESARGGVVPLAGATAQLAIPPRRSTEANLDGLFKKMVMPIDATRTAFPTTVVRPDQHIFMPGRYSPKLGDIVAKGRFRGSPIYSLTLEERKTCPPCEHRDDCYGNNMPKAKRFIDGDALEQQVFNQGSLLATKRRGVLFRLHVLGDFYSLDYLKTWANLARNFGGLRVFGYSAHKPTSTEGKYLLRLHEETGTRWWVRFSGWHDTYLSAPTLKYIPKNPDGSIATQVDGAIICPEQTGRVKSCAECGLCWTAKRPVAFIDHSLFRRGQA